MPTPLRIVFMGTPDFAVPALESLMKTHNVCLVVTQPDKPAGRKKQLSAPPVRVVADKANIPVLQSKSARTPEFLARVLEAKADVAVVVAYGKILPLAVLEAFPLGCLNIHGSLLPKYRGAAPIQWAVINGEQETGITIMQLDEGMDTGPVLLTVHEPISEEDTAGSLFERLAPLGAEAICRALDGLSAGTLTPQAQDESLATHAAMLKKPDGLVDWNQEAPDVASRIRGLDPWPGSFTPFGDGNLKLFGARALADEDVSSEWAAPGTMISYNNQGMQIACRQGVCVIAEVQAPGKKRMAADVFARGRRLAPGTTPFLGSLDGETK